MAKKLWETPVYKTQLFKYFSLITDFLKGKS